MISPVDNPLMGTEMVNALGQMQRQMRDLGQEAGDQVENPLSLLKNPDLSVQGQEAVSQANEVKGPTAADSVSEFAQMLAQAFENVNVLQNESAAMQSRFDVGDRSVSLADVMLASQKSSISFEATLQVRNRLADAYRSIMQMQI